MMARRGWRLACALASLACAVPALPAKVRVRLRGREVLALPGETLRSALIRGGLSPHNGQSKTINCRGLGTCGTCAVSVCSSSTATLEPATQTAVERVRLGLPPHRPPVAPRLRLACQCRVAAGEGTIVLLKHSGFWGSEEQLSDEPAEAFAAPLGRLEFALDRGLKPAPDESPADGSQVLKANPCESCGGSQMALCPACDGDGGYDAVYKLPDLPSMPDGSRPTGKMRCACNSCAGRGTVICRECFSGDPYDLEAIRAIMRTKPD